MAIIGKIRRKGGLLIAIFIGSALLAFILGDLLGPGGSLLSARQYDIGVISGETIPAQAFEQKVQDAIDNYKQQSNRSSLDQPTIDMLREQAWSQWVNEIILGKEYSKVGVAVHPDEIFNLVTGSNPHRLIVQAFSNPETGQYNPQDVINFLKNMENDPTGKSSQQWIPFEQSIQRDQLVTKYLNLIKNGMLTTNTELRRDYAAKNNSAKIRYAIQRYGSIPDSITPISETDVNNYYNGHKQEYEQESSRSIKYVSFKVNPSSDDTIAIVDWITRIKGEFEQISGMEENTDFVNMNADSRFEDKFLNPGTLEKTADSVMFDNDAAIETIYGPYLENGVYKLVKQIDVQYRPDSVKARHILKKFPENGDSSYVKISDSIYDLLRGGADFESLARSESEDEGSAVKGGDLGWFTEGTMVKPFNDSCFASNPGDLIKVYSQFGAHIIEILETTVPIKKIKVALIDRAIEPSSKTFAAVYAQANRFAGSNTTLEKFDAATPESGLVPRVTEDLKITDKTIVGLASPREVIRWAFKQEKGTVSGPFELGDQFVICVLTEVKEKGTAPLEQIRTEMEIGATNAKKAAYIINKMEENGDENIEDLIHNLSANNNNFDLNIETVNDLVFSSFNIPGVGREPELIGTIFGSEQGLMSKPIKGNAGVFVFVVDEFKEGLEMQDLSNTQSTLQNNIKNRVDYEVLNALKSKTEIEDNRHLFY